MFRKPYFCVWGFFFPLCFFCSDDFLFPFYVVLCCLNVSRVNVLAENRVSFVEFFYRTGRQIEGTLCKRVP